MSERLTSVVLATTNRGKLADFRLLLAEAGIDVTVPADHGLELEVDETGDTFVANALLKAHAYAERLDVAVLADDSGLAVDALGGAPGVSSARYAGEPCDDDANNAKLLRELDGVDDRRAAFVCALALVLPDGTEVVEEGRCDGTITHEVRGSAGFGYDVLFFRDDLGRTFGESTPDEKNARSHRGAAVRALVARLRREGRV